MNGGNRSGKGMGMGQGQGQGQGRGRMGGSRAAGPAGNCRCPNCGHIQPHERSVPCSQVKCPQCGSVMVRE